MQVQKHNFVDILLIYSHYKPSKPFFEGGSFFGNPLQLINVGQLLCKNVALRRHVCSFALLFTSRMANFPKTLVLVTYWRIQYARDDEELITDE